MLPVIALRSRTLGRCFAWLAALQACRAVPADAPRSEMPPSGRVFERSAPTFDSRSAAPRAPTDARRAPEPEPAFGEEPQDIPPAPEHEDLVFFVPEALPEGIKVLHIGDSFAAALGRPLNRELTRRGLRGALEFEVSTYIATWASAKPLRRYLRRHRPDLVLITLGANELFAAHLEGRARLVRKLVRKLGDRPCVWIAPALWDGAKPDLLRIIQENCAPCAYLETNQLGVEIERTADGIHPTREGGRRWARAVIEWLERNPPIRADRRWVRLEP